MTSLVLPGLPIGDAPGAGEPIVRQPTAATAFVGRTLKGPVNLPVTVDSFAAFQHTFGGLWQPATLSYAVEQFFENGGRRAIVVRVANGARAPSLALPAGLGALTLLGQQPGTREYLRAAVDYDGIGAAETDLFNLVVQRVRAPSSELVEDQEIFRRVSVQPGSDSYLVESLAGSRLVRVAWPLPPQRPDLTPAERGGAAGYVSSNNDGDDGGALTDYDLIGSSLERTGLFALQLCHQFNLLCIPPPARDRDVGMSVLLVATRLCRQRQAMLLVDPPLSWTSPAIALRAIADWPLRGHDLVMFFPRLMVFDRLRGRYDLFAPSGAAAGMLARHDESHPVWSVTEGDEPALRQGLRPACAANDLERARLAQLGVNTLQLARGGPRQTLRTLASEAGTDGEWRFLAARRLALNLIASIARGTRWAAFEPNEPLLRARVVSQVYAFLLGARDRGRIPSERRRRGVFRGVR